MLIKKCLQTIESIFLLKIVQGVLTFNAKHVLTALVILSIPIIDKILE